MDTESSPPSPLEIIAPYVAEFVGTFLLVFTIGCCTVAGSAMWNATAIASILMVSIYATGPISGGHLNPSVSLAVGLCGKMPVMRVIGYIVMQVGAGILAGLLYYGTFIQATPVGITPFNWFEKGVVEVIYTAMICFVVLNCAVSKRNNPDDDQNHFFALAIGFVIVAGGYAAGDISGAHFNPAVSIGIDITGAGASAAGVGAGSIWWLIYVAYQVMGSVLAAILFLLCRPNEFGSSLSSRVLHAPVVQVKVLAGYNLVNKDSGIAGDASDPYVVVRYGRLERKTPIVTNSLNPIWMTDNVFSFDVQPERGALIVEVVNSKNILQEQSLGSLSVDVIGLSTPTPIRRRELLSNGGGAELELELFAEGAEIESSPHPMSLEDEPTLGSRLISEFLGTFVLMLTVGLNIVMQSGVTAWSAGAALMCMIYSLGDVCGGHFNPAVTFAVMLSGRDKCPVGRAVLYLVGQLLAGLIAGFIVAGFHSVAPASSVSHPLAPKVGSTWWMSFTAETVFTFMLAFVVLAVATTAPAPSNTMQNFQFALAIGSCVTAGGFAIGGVSGGILNPAVAFGISMSNRMWNGSGPLLHWTNCLYYSLWELIGGLLAALVFYITHSHEYRTSEKGGYTPSP